MLRFLFLLSLVMVSGCSQRLDYTWQDTRIPVRDDANLDMEMCRDYAARQYKPGMPAGVTCLDEQSPPVDPTSPQPTGEWRPDRDPVRETSIHSTSVHVVPRQYTGYPGELDYYPDYLDDIFEKCMRDKGWNYLPAKDK